jgi:7,8-dihydro-6-hydroxymethylpterin dimethyltransferase
MSTVTNIYDTWSVCPVCLKRIAARRVKKDDGIFLSKTCPEHGDFESIIWRGYSDFDNWISNPDFLFEKEPQCPDECGLCNDHLRKTCCVLLNVTDRCNLQCRFCLANQTNNSTDTSLEEILLSLPKMVEKDKSLVQLSGGEPTMRDDLPDIVRSIKEYGARYVQLNSNGIRLGEDEEYVKKLAQAGLSFVFMQFDGTNDSINESLRGRRLLKIKQQAIDNCAGYNIGVTLVPTIVRNINTDNIGELVRFAISQSPKVRGIHFQPVSYFGRIPEKPSDNDRITLDELIHEIERQTAGLVRAEDLLPSSCDHPLCGFHGDFVVDNDKLFPLLNQSNKVAGCCDSAAADKNREFVAKRWQRPAKKEQQDQCNCGDIHNMEYFLDRVTTHGFTITSMMFQDAGSIDFSRLMRCSLHVYDNGKHIPFCAYYLSAWEQ